MICFGMIACCSLWAWQAFAQGSLPQGYQYTFPSPGANYIHPTSTVILRFSNITPKEILNVNDCIQVHGNQSGRLNGQTIIASDEQTLIFIPSRYFQAGEKVHVTINPQLIDDDIGNLPSLSYEFSILAEQVLQKKNESDQFSPQCKQDDSSSIVAKMMSNGVAVPSDFPSVYVNLNRDSSNDFIFVNTSIKPYYNIIFNTLGEPVWYRRTENSSDDFRVQANGWITMQWRDNLVETDWHHTAFTQNFEYIKSFQATNGYMSDMHEFYMLPDSGYLLLGKRETQVDMSQYVEDGQADAIVVETCIQEFTAEDQLIFIWRAWDHFDIADLELEDLTGSRIRFPHMNALCVDTEGHILLSSRHLSEISKIHRQSGQFIWRMSGNPRSTNNDFNFVNDPLNGFRNQHAIQVIGQNRYTLLDNGNSHTPPITRAVEYMLDTVHWTATLVWEYRNELNTRIARFMGNVQRLPNNNTHINWAVSNNPQIAIEVNPQGEKELEIWFENGANCYRSFRHPWDGKCASPYLLLDPHPDNLTLIFNKFGDDRVDYYKIYGGPNPSPTTLIDTSHNPMKQLVGLSNGTQHYFRITAIDLDGFESDFSNEENIHLNITQPNSNLILNGEFTEYLNDWEWKVDEPASAEIHVVDGVCSIVLQHAGNTSKDVRLMQKNLPIFTGQNYLLEFDASSEATRILEIVIEANHEPYTDYSRIGFIAINESMTHYSYAFKMKELADLNARISINAGFNTETIYLDNISLKRATTTTTHDLPMTNSDFILYQNYPNPFRSETNINYSIPETSLVSLIIYDSFGKRIKDYSIQEQGAGRYSRKIQLEKYDPGIYYYSLEVKAVHSANFYKNSSRMILLN